MCVLKLFDQISQFHLANSGDGNISMIESTDSLNDTSENLTGTSNLRDSLVIISSILAGTILLVIGILFLVSAVSML